MKFKKILVGLFLLTTVCFAKDKVKFIECGSIDSLNYEVSEFIIGKKVKNISVSMGSSQHMFKTMFYVACIVYEEEK